MFLKQKIGRVVTARALRAKLDGTIFPYDCSMRLAQVLSTTRIVSSNTTVAHDTKNVLGF